MLYTNPVVANITMIIYFFHIFIASCSLFVLTVRQCRASYCNYLKGKLHRPIKRIVQVKHNSVLILRIKMFGHRLDDP